MDNFNWSEFTKKIIITSDLEIVYNAWTKGEELEKWFLSKALFYDNNKIAISASENVPSTCHYEWTWFAQNHHEKGKIISANGLDFIEFSFAGDCVVQVQLYPINEVVIVELTQKNIPLDNASKEGIRLGCASGWAFYLVNLKSVLEGGLDLRNKDTSLKGVVNN